MSVNGKSKDDLVGLWVILTFAGHRVLGRIKGGDHNDVKELLVTDGGYLELDQAFEYQVVPMQGQIAVMCLPYAMVDAVPAYVRMENVQSLVFVHLLNEKAQVKIRGHIQKANEMAMQQSAQSSGLVIPTR